MYARAMKRLNMFISQLTLGIGLFVLLSSLFNGPGWLVLVAAIVVIIDATALAQPLWWPQFQRWWRTVRVSSNDS